MGRSKTLKFADNAANRNVVQVGKEFYENCKGKWNKDFFKNDNDIVLELACGRGEYSIGLAKDYPERNFIGIDIKGARIWNGSNQAIKDDLSNVAFLRIHIQNIGLFFEEEEISEVWIVHPDPRPKKSDRHRRLTHPRFLDEFRRLLKKRGTVRLKTDNSGFFEYTLDVLNARNDIEDLVYTEDLYKSPLLEEHHGIKTRYEELFSAEGHDIKYLRFSFRS